METAQQTTPTPVARRNRRLRQVSAELPKEAADLADSLVPESCYQTEAALRRGATGVRHNTQYLPQVIRAILRNVMRGMNRGTAAELCGIRAAQFYNWCSEHPDLPEALARAEAHLERDLIEVVRGGFTRNPRLALEVLERRLPRTWAPQSRHEHNGTITHAAITPDLLHRLAEARARRDAAAAVEHPPHTCSLNDRQN